MVVDSVDLLFERVVTPSLVKKIIHNSEAIRGANRRWRKNNPEKKAVYSRLYRERITKNHRYRAVVANNKRYRHSLCLANRRISLLEAKVERRGKIILGL